MKHAEELETKADGSISTCALNISHPTETMVSTPIYPSGKYMTKKIRLDPLEK
jgi:hypothetical protein